MNVRHEKDSTVNTSPEMSPKGCSSVPWLCCRATRLRFLRKVQEGRPARHQGPVRVLALAFHFFLQRGLHTAQHAEPDRSARSCHRHDPCLGRRPSCHGLSGGLLAHKGRLSLCRPSVPGPQEDNHFACFGTSEEQRRPSVRSGTWLPFA